MVELGCYVCGVCLCWLGYATTHDLHLARLCASSVIGQRKAAYVLETTRRVEATYGFVCIQSRAYVLDKKR